VQSSKREKGKKGATEYITVYLYPSGYKNKIVEITYIKSKKFNLLLL
jgi:hypothetical protein